MNRRAEPQGCAFHPVMVLVATLGCSLVWFAIFPSLIWLASMIFDLVEWMLP